MTKAQVIAAGDAACSESRKTTDVISKLLGDSSDPQQVADATRKFADAADKVVARFAALRPPPDGRAVIAKYIAKGKEQIVLARRAADQLDQGNVATANTLIDSGQATAGELRGIAQGYGFKVCGSGK